MEEKNTPLAGNVRSSASDIPCIRCFVGVVMLFIALIVYVIGRLLAT